MKNSILLCLVLITVSMVKGQDINGKVNDAQGNPVEKAYIYPTRNTETDSNGLFSIKIIESDFLIILSDFKPLFKKLNGETNLEIKLDVEKEEEKLKLPKCSKKHFGSLVGVKKGNSAGINLISVFPKEFKIAQSKDIDYMHYSISNSLNEKQRLEIWWGGNATSGFPKINWLKNSEEVQIRSVINQKRNIGYDYFGKTNDGKFWRFIQVRLQSNYYIVDSENMRDYFDKSINSSCVTID